MRYLIYNNSRDHKYSRPLYRSQDMIHDFQAYPIQKSHVAFLNIQKWIEFDIKQPAELYNTKKEMIK